MKSSVEKLNDTRVKLTVEVPFEELTNEVDQAYKAIAAQVSIPGFRKGKAPRKLIDARFGRGPILEQVVNDMLPNKYQAAITEQDLNVLGQPNIEITKLEDNELVEFTAEVDVRPDFDLPNFEEISVTVDALSVSDADIDAEIDRLRERFSELNPIERPLAEGDFSVIDITAEIDGEKIEEATAEGLSYILGANDFIDGLDDALTGLKEGESVDFQTTLKTGDHAGEEATVTVVVTQAKERVLPELNEEFVQLASEFDTVEELRESIVEQLNNQAKSNQAAAIRDAVLDNALELTPFPLPEAVVEDQAHNALHQTFGELAHNEAVIEDFLKTQNSSLEQFKEEAKENAVSSVRSQLFLDALVDQEKPEVSQQELTDHILFTSRSYGIEPQELMAQLQDPSQLAALYSDIARGKALANAICRVTVTDHDGNTIDATEYFGADTEATDTDAEENNEAAE